MLIQKNVNLDFVSSRVAEFFFFQNNSDLWNNFANPYVSHQICSIRQFDAYCNLFCSFKSVYNIVKDLLLGLATLFKNKCQVKVRFWLAVETISNRTKHLQRVFLVLENVVFWENLSQSLCDVVHKGYWLLSLFIFLDVHINAALETEHR